MWYFTRAGHAVIYHLMNTFTHMEAEKQRKSIHLGRNAQRIREIVGLKQDTLASRTGMSQQNISRLEQSEYIPDDVLAKLAEGLGVAPELIKNFDEEKAVYNIQNHFIYQDNSTSHNQHHQPTINHTSPEVLEMLNNATRVIGELTGQIRALQEELSRLKK